MNASILALALTLAAQSKPVLVTVEYQWGAVGCSVNRTILREDGAWQVTRGTFKDGNLQEDKEERGKVREDEMAAFRKWQEEVQKFGWVKDESHGRPAPVNDHLATLVGPKGWVTVLGLGVRPDNPPLSELLRKSEEARVKQLGSLVAEMERLIRRSKDASRPEQEK
jgi:hypothetical protein